MKTPDEQPSHNENKNLEPAFTDILRELDASDTRLLMSYARHIDHSGLHTAADVDGALTRIEESFTHMIRKVFHGDMGSVEERSLVVAQVFDDLIDRRIDLFTEYTQMTPKTPEEHTAARLELVKELQRTLTDSAEVFRGEMLDQFYAILSTDAKIVDSLRERPRFGNLASRFGDLALTHSRDVLKIGLGVALGTIVAQRFARK